MDTLMQVMRVRGSRMKSHVPLADYPIPEAHEPDDIYVLVTIKQQEKELAVVWSTLDWAMTE
ncbi:hypothetical protein L914_03958 [Phytophthora nicotianae]|uniref:Uncharacterized protein n=1 Tax=Phytophthora nicotianae TaxID=4792 RepID=W2NUR0_PHYNI|nr:hypothetical protein L914_03958 [Phytophthora nicotianae]